MSFSAGPSSIRITVYDQFSEPQGRSSFDAPDRLALPPGTGPSLGVRHANDKSMSIQLTAGVRVLVCDNGALIGEIEALRRKHTSGLDLQALITQGIEEYLSRLPGFALMHERLASAPLIADQAKVCIHDAFLDHRVMAPKYLPAVSDCYFRPQEHKERFSARTRWTTTTHSRRSTRPSPLPYRPGFFMLSAERCVRGRISLGETTWPGRTV